MGKNTKRKQKGRGKQQQSLVQDADGNNETPLATATHHQGPLIVQKLRHNDPKIRHAALAALVHTSSSSLHLSTLHAVRDQLMDRTHTECASMAAACLSNFLAFAIDDEQYHILTAGWILLFVERLRDCYRQIESSLDLAAAAERLSSTQLYLHWELAERCWMCLAHLIENNPVVMEQKLLRSASLQQEMMALLFQYLDLTTRPVVAREQYQPLSDAVQIMASRCLHSMWDDNTDFLSAWVLEDPTAQQSLELLVTFLRNASSTARLHAVGAYCSFWNWAQQQQQQQQHSYNWGTVQPSSVLEECLAILRQTLEWNSAARSAQLSQLMALYQTHQQDQVDEVLEKQIVTEQEQKKEPAKLIARRLKRIKEERGGAKNSSKEQDEGEEVADSQMQDEHVVINDWESALEHWLSSLRPLQLALEITANLTVSAEMVANETTEDGDALMGDSHPSVNKELFHILFDASFPDCIVELMKNLYESAWGDANPMNVPEAARTSIGELQSKVAVCLGNCITGLHDDNDHRLWNVDIFALWKYMMQAWETAVDDNAAESLCATMAMTLQSTRGNEIVQSLELNDIELLVHQLQQTTSVIATRDIICMLGVILCSSGDHDGFRFHTLEVNEAMAKSLIEVGTTGNQSPVVLSETLRVLMDIYGNDDCYPQLFDSLHILGYFQASVPALKQCISLSRDAHLDDIEQWKETAFNATRFIQYKKGYGNE